MTFSEWLDFFLPYVPGFLQAAWLVLVLTIFIIVVSWICGLVAALARASSVAAFRQAAIFYIWFIRGTPALIQIFIIYFGLPPLGVQLSPFTAGVLALGLNSGAYVAEIIRAGLSAIPRGQTEVVAGARLVARSRSCGASSCPRWCASSCPPSPTRRSRP